MQVCISLQTDNHTSTPPLSYYMPDALPATQPTASKVSGSGISWAIYASLHLAPDRQPHQHPTTQLLHAGCPSCHPTNSVKALKAIISKEGNKISTPDCPADVYVWRYALLVVHARKEKKVVRSLVSTLSFEPTDLSP